MAKTKTRKPEKQDWSKAFIKINQPTRLDEAQRRTLELSWFCQRRFNLPLSAFSQFDAANCKSMEKAKYKLSELFKNGDYNQSE